jgi:hypothetical protein
MPTLQEVIAGHEAVPVLALPAVPTALPPAHLLDSRDFPDYVAAGGIRPTFCDFFKDHLVYLYYGGLFFRRSLAPELLGAMYPVGLLFSTESLNQIDTYYPFDTGALAGPFYGQTEDIDKRWTDCRIDGAGDPAVAPRLVRYLFGNNKRYLRGQVSTVCSTLPDPFPWLIRFLRNVRTDLGADQRQYRIECLTTSSVSFAKLIWVGYPSRYAPAFGKIFEKRLAGAGGTAAPTLPERWSYETYRAGRPAEMAAVLQQEAHTFVRNRIDHTI